MAIISRGAHWIIIITVIIIIVIVVISLEQLDRPRHCFFTFAAMSSDDECGFSTKPRRVLHPIMFMQCSVCGIRRRVPPPSDSVHNVRFCLAEGPPAKCMHCCTCITCIHRTAVYNFLYASDKEFSTAVADSQS